jgi:hypothetical protein
MIASSTPFIPGETPENCVAYHSVYLAYTHDIFGHSILGRPTTRQLNSIHDSKHFRTFYERLVSYLNITPSPRILPKRKALQSDVEMPNQVSISSDPLPRDKHKQKKDKETKGKIKVVQPIKKSTEQVTQEAELRRIADRERDQKKKGKYVTTTAEGDVLINLGKKHVEDAVCLHSELVAVMKPHQIEGVQFIWKQVLHREIVTYPRLS